MKHYKIYIKDQDKTSQEFSEFFRPIFESGRADFTDIDQEAVLTFYNDEDVVAMNLKFGNRIYLEEPSEDVTKFLTDEFR